MSIAKKQLVEIVGVTGVILSLLFLTYEIRQSNNIANREAQTEISTLGFELNRTVIENPQFSVLRAKLRDADPVLSDDEREQAIGWALLQINYWSLVSTSYENGMMSEDGLQRQINSGVRILRRYPGLRSYISNEFEEIGVVTGISLLYDQMLNELKAS